MLAGDCGPSSPDDRFSDGLKPNVATFNFSHQCGVSAKDSRILLAMFLGNVVRKRQTHATILTRHA